MTIQWPFRDRPQISLEILHEFKRVNFYSPLYNQKTHDDSDDFRGNRSYLICLILEVKFGDKTLNLK